MGRKYFGTDGVRGRVGEAPITPEFVMRLGYAAGRVLAQRTGPRPAVLIGKDTRISGYMLENALVSGICSMGGRRLGCWRVRSGLTCPTAILRAEPLWARRMPTLSLYGGIRRGCLIWHGE